MWEIGDYIPVPVNTFVNGVATDPGALTITLTCDQPGVAPQTFTWPGGGPTITKLAVGQFSAVFVPVANGRYSVAAVATGAAASAFADSILVVDGGHELLIGLDEARASITQAGQVPTTAVSDEDLRSLIASCRPAMEDLCGPIIPRTIVGETQDGGSIYVILDWAPLISIQSVQESWGNYVRTITSQPLTGTGFDAYGYTADLRTGKLVRRVSGASTRWAKGQENILVNYTAGRSIMSPNLQRACRRMVRWAWQSEMQGQRPNGTKPDTVVATPGGYSMPSVVKVLCADDVRAMAVA